MASRISLARFVQGGVKPTSTNALLSELHRTWARPEAAELGKLYGLVAPNYAAVGLFGPPQHRKRVAIAVEERRIGHLAKVAPANIGWQCQLALGAFRDDLEEKKIRQLHDILRICHAVLS